MKASEAPEKIYMTPSFGEPDNVLFASFSKSHLDFHRDIEYTRIDVFMKKAKEAFCKAVCNGHPPRSTCTSLGTCKEYDNFIKFLRE